MELRCFDLSPFAPNGLSLNTLHDQHFNASVGE